MSERAILSTGLRLAIIDTMVRLEKLGLNKGTAGNISVRRGDGFFITPSGMSPQQIHPDDIVPMEMDGTSQGRCKPSSEWLFHRDIYAARAEINAIVHGHPPFCVALAVHRRAIPAYHYMVAKAGGNDIRCASYATFGTQELSDQALIALEGRKACLLANHGMIATGPSLHEAVALAVEVEELAEGYWRSLQLGQPILLSDEEMATTLALFSTYGRNAQQQDATDA
jgi:L-fuculose-phosphate aldolase